jgi:hypothetical protein
MTEIVWCQSCKTVVWAYDQIRTNKDIRGLMNEMAMPCPKCGEIGNFNGWFSKDLDQVAKSLPEAKIYDGWSAMRAIAKAYSVKWEISPDCTWFRRPNHTDGDYHALITGIKEYIKDYQPKGEENET